MSKALVVVESEQKARTIEAQLGDQVRVLWLAETPLQAVYQPPADAMRKETPKFKFLPLPSQAALLTELAENRAEDLLLAFDGDQRGEYWAWMIEQHLAAKTGGLRSAHRLRLPALEKEALGDALRLVEPVTAEAALPHVVRNMFNACLGKHLQRLIGTATGPQGLPLNINSLTLLALLLEREAEIAAFRPARHWQARVRLASPAGEFEARLEEVYGIMEDGAVRDAAELRKATEIFRDQPFVVEEIGREEIEVAPPAPYRLADLLAAAKADHGLAPGRTMMACRRLYEGRLRDGVAGGLITALSPMAGRDFSALLDKLRQQATLLYPAPVPSAAPPEFAHSGILLPVRPEWSPESLRAILDDDEYAIYRLIYQRALAAFLGPARVEVIELAVRAGKESLFRADGRQLLTPGFLAAEPVEHFAGLRQPSPLARLGKGESLTLGQVIPEQGGGFPPEYYALESLAAELGEFAMPFEPATVILLQRMIESDYLALASDATLRCRENAERLSKVLNRALPTMTGIHLIAYFEQTVNEVISGRKSLRFALQQFDQTLMMQGNVLVQVKLPEAISRSRPRSSSRIIKSAPGGGEAVRPEAAAEPALSAPAPAAIPDKSASQASELTPVAELTAGEQDGGAMPAPEEAVVAQAPIAEAAGEEATSESTVDADRTTTDYASSQEVSEIEEEPPAVAAVAEEEEKKWAEAEPTAAVEEKGEQGPSSPSPAVSRADLPATVVPGPQRDCPECGRPLLLKEDRFGKYWSCSGHPLCRHSESYDRKSALDLLCPLCHRGKVISKETPTGKPFYVCPEPECEFMAWSRPHPVPCPLCASPFLVEKKGASGTSSLLRCPRAGCGYQQPMPGAPDDGGASPDESGGPPRKKILVRRVKAGSGAGSGTRKVRIVRRSK